MKRFMQGDLAVTCNTRAPLVNDGHLVRILLVWGEDPELGLEFAYEVERVDGKPFALARRAPSPMPTAGSHRLLADHWQLRPLQEVGDAQPQATIGLEV